MRRPVRRRYASFLRLTVLVAAAIVGISYFSVQKLLFVSTKDAVEGKQLIAFAQEIRETLQQKYPIEQFTCKTKDHISLAGLFLQRENPIGTLLLCHGYRCCKELAATYIDLFPQYNIVFFDFRAHGENERCMTTIGCHEYKDIPAVVKWIKTNKPQIKELPFIILGISMGGAAALRAVEEHPTLCDALIVDSSFSSLKSLLEKTFTTRSGLPAFPFFTIMKKMFNYLCSCDLDAFQPIKSVKKIQRPLLLIHSCSDKYIPVEESLLMYAQGAQTGAKLWVAPECEHGRLHQKYPKLYVKKVEKFLDKHVFDDHKIV